MEFEPLYYKERLERRTINPRGIVGVITLWNKWRNVAEKYREKYPDLFEKNSPITLFSNLYGNGLPQMLANLAHNPQISKLAVVGNDTQVVPSYTYLRNFLEKGVEIEEIGGKEMARIKGTNFYIDRELKPEYFNYLDVRRFDLENTVGFYNFVTSKKKKFTSKKRQRITLESPNFTDFPSDIASHRIIAETPTDAWVELVFRLDRFGRNIFIRKGSALEKRRILLDVSTIIKNPKFEDEKVLEDLGFNPEELINYGRAILSPNIPKGNEYSYGNRLRAYWNGKDTLEAMAAMLKDNPEHTFAFTTLWNPSNDLIKRNAAPCFTDIHFIKNPEDDKLMLIAGFRAQDLISAWMPNMYGLRSIQEFVSQRSDLEAGQINLRTRHLSMDPMSPYTITALARVDEQRKSPREIFDPKGNYVVEAVPNKGLIQVKHYSPEGTFLEEIMGKNMIEVKDKLRALEAFTSIDHAMWIGMELAKAQSKLDRVEND